MLHKALKFLIFLEDELLLYFFQSINIKCSSFSLDVWYFLVNFTHKKQMFETVMCWSNRL